jgi:GTP pyrophosphokinase/guanosine-3',5'-bis(diphosphate) 3'-pyrophosphohydrolase
MRAGIYSDAEITQIIDAYQFATRLFANRFRAEGKPFCAHLVGTAGIMVELRAPTPVIVAALLHAAYQEGDFGATPDGMTDAKRKLVRQIVGEEAEALIADYTQGSRSTSGLWKSYQRFDELTARERVLLEMQLANELDDYRDLAALHASNTELRIKKIVDTWKIQVEMAQRLGRTDLAEALRDAYQCTLETTLSDSLRSSEGDGYEILPAACKLRLSVRIVRLWGRVQRRLRRFLVPTQCGLVGR